MPMAGQPIIVSISDEKACPKARSTHRTLFQRTLDRCTRQTRSSCAACLTRLILHTTAVANQIISNILRGLGPRQPISAIRPGTLGEPQRANDSSKVSCESWAHTQKIISSSSSRHAQRTQLWLHVRQYWRQYETFPRPQRCSAY